MSPTARRCLCIPNAKRFSRPKVTAASSSALLARFFAAAVKMMQTMARACGHDHLGKFHGEDIATWHKDMADLTGINYSGFRAGRGGE